MSLLPKITPISKPEFMSNTARKEDIFRVQARLILIQKISDPVYDSKTRNTRFFKLCFFISRIWNAKIREMDLVPDSVKSVNPDPQLLRTGSVLVSWHFGSGPLIRALDCGSCSFTFCLLLSVGTFTSVFNDKSH